MLELKAQVTHPTKILFYCLRNFDNFDIYKGNFLHFIGFLEELTLVATYRLKYFDHQILYISKLLRQNHIFRLQLQNTGPYFDA